MLAVGRTHVSAGFNRPSAVRAVWGLLPETVGLLVTSIILRLACYGGVR